MRAVLRYQMLIVFLMATSAVFAFMMIGTQDLTALPNALGYAIGFLLVWPVMGSFLLGADTYKMW